MKYIKYTHALLASLTICLDSTVNKLLAKRESAAPQHIQHCVSGPVTPALTGSLAVETLQHCGLEVHTGQSSSFVCLLSTVVLSRELSLMKPACRGRTGGFTAETGSRDEQMGVERRSLPPLLCYPACCSLKRKDSKNSNKFPRAL